MKIFIDTCVLPRCQLETAKIYCEACGDKIGFELLPMFDLADFEANLEANIEFFKNCAVSFHEPVWGVEHSSPKNSEEYKAGMYHIMLTKKFADILHPSHMVYHFNNCTVTPDTKQSMLANSLANLEEMREIFSGVTILVENTGTDSKHDKLLDQQEFTSLCIEKNFDVLIDVGHANANSWNITKLIDDLKPQVRAFHFHNNNGRDDQHNRLRDGTINFDRLIPYVCEQVPDADIVIEYTRPQYHGADLLEDIEYLWNRIY